MKVQRIYESSLEINFNSPAQEFSLYRASFLQLYQLGNKTPHICIQKKFMMSYRLNYFRSEIIFDEIG